MQYLAQIHPMHLLLLAAGALLVFGVVSTVTVSGARTGEASGSETIGPYTLTNADAPVGKTTQLFAAGVFESLLLPDLVGSSKIEGVIIDPPDTNTGTIKLKGVTGDTGIDLHKTKQSGPLSLNSTTNLGLTCSADTVITLTWL